MSTHPGVVSEKALASLGLDGEHSFDLDPQRGWATVDSA